MVTIFRLNSLALRHQGSKNCTVSLVDDTSGENAIRFSTSTRRGMESAELDGRDDFDPDLAVSGEGFCSVEDTTYGEKVATNFPSDEGQTKGMPLERAIYVLSTGGMEILVVF